ncbi:MAG TPA: aspartate/glutamate racemase family protein [Propionibacteriaceae bacterium]|nr:aspartate/glutamate racemase family protein [Propionibacteriaceae bacterium]
MYRLHAASAETPAEAPLLTDTSASPYALSTSVAPGSVTLTDGPWRALHERVAAVTEAVVLTCSSVSGLAGDIAAAAGIPVLRIDEAMADEAARIGGRIGVVATLSTTLDPSVALIRERMLLANVDAEIDAVVVDGAFDAVVAGDRATHDRLVQESIRALAARGASVVVLAQGSMVSAAEGADVSVPVLSSPASGIRRAAEQLGLH